MRFRRIRGGAVLPVIAALAAVTSPVGAIINGAEDGTAHPYAVAVGPKTTLYASGVLVSPTVVVTAGHVANRRLGDHQAMVTFDAIADPSSTWHTGTAYVAPTIDLGVIVLEEPVTDVEPATLPTSGLLDMIGSPHLKLLGIGYGISQRTNEPGDGKPGVDRTSGGVRRSMAETFAAGTPTWFQATSSSDTCLGDSGGPALVGDSDVVAGVLTGAASSSGGECVSQPSYVRLDTAVARSFLGQYVDLP